ILDAASSRVNVRILYQLVDTANRPWPTNVTLAADYSGRAAHASVAPRKMACRPAARGCIDTVQGHQLAQGGSLVAAPFLMRNGDGRQDARPCFARRCVTLLHRRCLGFG